MPARIFSATYVHPSDSGNGSDDVAGGHVVATTHGHGTGVLNLSRLLHPSTDH